MWVFFGIFLWSYWKSFSDRNISLETPSVSKGPESQTVNVYPKGLYTSLTVLYMFSNDV